MNYLKLKKYLFNLKDEKFANFSKSLSNSDYEVIGVKNPILRELIKEHKDNNELDPNDFEPGKYLEIDFIYFGLSLSRLKNIWEQLCFLKNNIKFAKSWAITDIVPSYLKKYTFDQFYSFFLDSYKSKNLYERRLAYVLGLKLSKDENILKILKLIVLNEEYMVMMSEAWLLQTIAITYEDKVYSYLKNIDDVALIRKAISKICDSFRFNESSKNRFKELRKNL